ncbi:MAG: flippase [Candidatus Margulisiibacteriota bacterium]|jgi:O-antigen/teichoic acid export membrane protein
MISEHAKVAANTTWFTLALVLQKFVSFIYFTYLARNLGASRIGSYVFALSFIAIFSIIIDFGTNHFITREVAKDYTQAQNIFSNILGFKLITSFLALLVVILAVNLLGYSLIVRELVYIASLLMIIESLVLTGYSIIRGFHNLKYESIGTIGVQVLTLICGIIAMQFTDNLSVLMFILVVSNFLNLLFVFLLIKFKIKLNLSFRFDWNYWHKIVHIVIPFALAAGFTKIYAAFDQILLSKLADSQALGFYAVAYKLAFALQFLPLALVAALYPAISTFFKTDKNSLNKVFTRAIYYLLIITIPMTAGIFVLAPEFINTLYTSAYAQAILPLKILILSLVFLFLNFPLGSLLNAADKQARNTINISLAMIFNIILNIILIPYYQATGAAMASLFSTIFLFLINIRAVKGIINIDNKYILSIAGKTILSGIIMGLVIYYLKSQLYWLLAGIIGAIVYLILQFILSSITKRDILQMYQSFIKKEL